MSVKAQIIDLLLENVSNGEITRRVGCSSATVSYHRRKLGLAKANRPTYNWSKIQTYYNAGHSMYECMAKFGFAKRSWELARLRGALEIQIRTNKRPLEVYLVSNRPKTSRHGLKSRLLCEGFLRNHCYNPRCMFHDRDIPTWNDAPLVLHLDHMNGLPKDNRLENLQLLCPNCHRQTSTYAGRNNRKA